MSALRRIFNITGAWRRSQIVLISALCGLCAALPSQAAVVSGSFSGLAYDSRIQVDGPIMGNFDGQRVNGAFSLDTSDQGQFVDPIYWGEYSATYLLRLGSLKLSFSAAGEKTTFVDDFPTITLYKSPDAQYVTLGYGSHPLYHGQLTLYGDLFRDLWWPDTFHAGPIDLRDSYASFDDGRYFGAGVRLTSVTFDTPSVPEPPTLLLFLVALPFVARSRAHWHRKQQLAISQAPQAA